MKIIVGTGWWSDGKKGYKNLTRSSNFFPIWKYFVDTVIKPEQIVVIDSAAPDKPDFSKYENVEVINLDKNYMTGNAIKKGLIKTKYNGWTRSCFLAASYALACDADLFIYIEQDCLIFGDDFINASTHSGNYNVWMGSPPGKGYHTVTGELVQLGNFNQVSLMFANKFGIIDLIKACVDGPHTDGEKPAEKRISDNLGGRYNFIKIPFGRSRPLDFSEPNMYAQDWNEFELKEFLKLHAPHLLDQLFNKELVDVRS